MQQAPCLPGYWLTRSYQLHTSAKRLAQLVFGNGMIMLGSVANGSAWGEHIAQPDEIGGRETQCPCVIVADCPAHYARAKAAGAQVLAVINAKGEIVWHSEGYSIGLGDQLVKQVKK